MKSILIQSCSLISQWQTCFWHPPVSRSSRDFLWHVQYSIDFQSFLLSWMTKFSQSEFNTNPAVFISRVFESISYIMFLLCRYFQVYHKYIFWQNLWSFEFLGILELSVRLNIHRCTQSMSHDIIVFTAACADIQKTCGLSYSFAHDLYENMVCVIISWSEFLHRSFALS